MAKKELTYEELCSDIRSKKFAPVYVLMGEEAFFIDSITDLLLQHVLPEEAKDFNQMVFYGADATATQIIDAARRYPMMSDFQLIVVKEAQLLSDLEALVPYVKHPLPSTVLVLNHKYKNLDKRKSLASTIAKNGIVFESKKIPEYKMAAYITACAQQKKLSIEPKAIQMLAEFIGNDLHTLHKELDKLLIIIEKETNKRITPELIERNIGISKEYNNFELLKAIILKDALKANRIIKHFEKNPKANPIQVTLTVLFNYFSNLLICIYTKDKSEMGIMNELGFHSPYQAKDYVMGLKCFPPMKVFNLIHDIRMADAHSKGVGNPSTTAGELLKELLYKILH